MKSSDEVRRFRAALEDIVQQRGLLCTSECHASQRMVEIASAALASSAPRRINVRVVDGYDYSADVACGRCGDDDPLTERCRPNGERLPWLCTDCLDEDRTGAKCVHGDDPRICRRCESKCRSYGVCRCDPMVTGV